MTGRKKAVWLAILLCVVFFAGCDSLGLGRKDKDIQLTPEEKEKAELLGKIDRKFEDPQTHYELGQLYQAEGRWAEAENQYNITLGFDPVHRQAQAARIKVLQNSGDTEKAKLLTNIYMEQASSSASASLNLAIAFQKQQMDEHALQSYQQALRLAPNSAAINKQIGYYYLSKNDKERAKDYLSRSFNLNRDQPEVAGELGRLGVMIQRKQKTKESVKKLDKIVK